jgi:hypothetical protein
VSIKNKKEAGCGVLQWLKPVIPATGEVEVRRIAV